MEYSLDITRQSLKELAKINEPFYSSIKKALDGLTLDPRPNGYKKLKGREGYRIRVGDYRVIYDIFDSLLLIEVITFWNRKDVYD